jgi:hypothetical protein
MHCVICDKNLKDHESVRRHGMTGEFLDLCDGCLKEIPGLPTKGGQGLDTVSDPFEDVNDASNIDDVRSLDNVTNCYNLNDEDD